MGVKNQMYRVTYQLIFDDRKSTKEDIKTCSFHSKSTRKSKIMKTFFGVVNTKGEKYKIIRVERI